MLDNVVEVGRDEHEIDATETELGDAEEDIDDVPAGNPLVRECVAIVLYVLDERRVLSQAFRSGFERGADDLGEIHRRDAASPAQLVSAADQHVHAVSAYYAE